MHASDMHSQKLDKLYTMLDTALFKLDGQKSKDKEYKVVKIISVFQTVVHVFPLIRRLKHGLSYQGYL